MRTIPNTDHGLKGDAVATLLTFYRSVLEGGAMPRMTWKVRAPGRILVHADAPLQVRKWSATNPDARDFRLQTIGEAWKPEPLKAEQDGLYVAEQPEPQRGWSAFLIEAVFPDPLLPGGTVTLTSGVSVVPDRLPHELPERTLARIARRPAAPYGSSAGPALKLSIPRPRQGTRLAHMISRRISADVVGGKAQPSVYRSRAESQQSTFSPCSVPSKTSRPTDAIEAGRTRRHVMRSLPSSCSDPIVTWTTRGKPSASMRNAHVGVSARNWR
jgi:hypothetical protein